MPRPPGALPLSAIQITALAAVISGARTVREVRDAVGWHSENTAWNALRVLRTAGLVAWVDGKAGTLHATVRPVPVLTAIRVESEL